MVLQRDTDIHTTSKIASLFEGHSTDYFVLTGSYSIEALTQRDVSHNDIDANVFTPSIPDALARTSFMLHRHEITDKAIEAKSSNRLEYILSDSGVEQQLEIQFVEISGVRANSEGFDFLLPCSTENLVVVPTVKASLTDSTDKEHVFRVKSLPFAIATWALRISGIAQAQKRKVRQTDIDHFAFLSEAPHDIQAVLDAIKYHPQMPKDIPCNPEEVLKKAAKVVNS